MEHVGPGMRVLEGPRCLQETNFNTESSRRGALLRCPQLACHQGMQPDQTRQQLAPP